MTEARDLTILAGDTYSKTWGLVVAGQVVDLTDGWTIRAQFRRHPADAAVLHECDVHVTAPIDVDGEIQPSTVQLRIPAADTARLAGQTAFWDLEISHPTWGPGGQLYVRTVLSGAVRIDWDVTR